MSRVVAALVFACQVATPTPAAGRDSWPPIPSHTLDHERNTIEVFRAASDSVVYVTNARLQRSIYNLDVLKIPQGSGSGIIWDARGHVLTNFHVIQGGNALSVTFGDGSTHDATVVGFDTNKDLAVLKIDAPPEKLVPVARGDSEALVVGQKVLAIGNPFGLDHTLTVGVISALGREIQSLGDPPTTIEDVIQTDASINPGNSGGPLLDSAGHMIGINTQIVSRSGQSAGIGFAVPVATIERITPQLIRFGKVRRAGLGIQVVPDSYARQWRVEGVIIRSVGPGSPAEQAGLRSLRADSRFIRSFDAIIGVDEEPVRNYNDLYQALDGRRPGESVTIRYQRDGVAGEAQLRLIALD
jgi:S1-C subfamily serine protease